MTLIKACIIGNSVKNTGKECDISMGPTAMIILAPPSTEISEADLEDPLAWAKELMHAPISQRIFPLFGSVAPINVINNDQESDVTVTLDDGTKVNVRLGVYNRTFETIAGGLCYAEALISFIGSGYRVIEIDQQGKMLLHKNSGTPKTWGALITSYIGGMAPTLSSLKDIFRNRFGYSFTPQELVNSGEIFTGAGELLQLMGLIDAEFTASETVQTTTHIYFGLKTHCAETDLVSQLGDDLEDVDLWVVTNKATGVVVVPTAANVTNGEMDLTGAFVSGQTYVVTGSGPDVWFGLEIEGYDATNDSIDIIIP